MKGDGMQYLLPDKVYKIGKWAGLIAIPAVAAFVGTVGTAVGWDGTSVCVIVINAAATLIGALLGVSQATAKEEAND